jgi:hypothetical protein
MYTSLNRSKSAGEIDDLSLILIDFYVTALTPRLHGSEAAMQLSENITILAACTIYTCVISEEG